MVCVHHRRERSCHRAPDTHCLGLDLKGWGSLEATGYNFGPDMLWAMESGKCVSYVYKNPESDGSKYDASRERSKQ